MGVVATGILSSLIASIVYAVLSFGIKPRIKISDKICVTDNKDGTFTYKIKIVNCSRFSLVNVSYHLDYGVYGRGDISYVTEIFPNKPPIPTITRYNRKNTDYALRITYVFDPNKYECDSDSYFSFKIQATHPLSNSVAYKEKRYKAEDIKPDCTFHTGKSLDIIDTVDRSSNLRLTTTP